MYAHDFNLARFDITISEEGSFMIIRLDKDNLVEAIQPYCPGCSDDGPCFEQYMKMHLAIEINDEKVQFSYTSHEQEEDMTELVFALDHSLEDVKKIGMYNDVLMEVKSTQENLVSSNLHGRNRTFRMHKDRIRIIMEY